MNILKLQDRLDSFRMQFPNFIERLPSIVEAIDITLNHSGLSAPNSKADKSIFLLCNAVVCEFEEVIHLCSGGFGIGSMKVLRGMFEKTVTADYLMRNPKEAICFMAFHRIQDHKLKAEQKRLSAQQSVLLSRAERFRQKVTRKFKFDQEDCKRCGTRKQMISWSKKSIKDLSNFSNYNLSDYYGFCYQAATLHSHATLHGVSARLSISGNDALSLESTQETEYVQLALYHSHVLFLVALHIVNDQFNLGMINQLNVWNEDLLYCYRSFL